MIVLKAQVEFYIEDSVLEQIEQRQVIARF